MGPLVFYLFFGLATAVGLAVVAILRRGARIEQLAADAAEAARLDLRRGHATSQIAARLRETDPEFDASRFEERVARAFLAVRRGRAAGDLRAARALVSDGVYERLLLELEDRRRRGPGDGAVAERHWSIEAVHIAHVEAGEVFDHLTVGIRAWCDGEPVGEFWTFLRRHGAHTRDAPGLLEKSCPNCSAPIEAVERPQCASCGALLRSGEHDWVLAEITQPDSWRPRAAARIPGVAALLEKDPGFSPQHVEDRVGVIFWRLALAERERSGAERLVALADPAWCQSFDERQAAAPRPSQLALAMEPVLRSIDLVGVLEEDDWHRIAVAVDWSGWLPPRPEWPARGLRRTRVLVLARRADAKTEVGRAVSSAHCARCGAPESERGRPDCAWCAEPLNDGRRSWILVDAVPARTDRARAIVQRFSEAPVGPVRQPAFDRLVEGAFPWVAKLLAAEGTIDERGRRLLEELAARWDLDAANQALQVDVDPAKDAGFDAHDIRRALPVLADIALAHEVLGPAASAVLVELGTRAGLTELDVRLQIDLRLREWDGRAEAERQSEADRERAREHREWRNLVAEDAARND